MTLRESNISDKSILVADDDFAIRSLLQDILEIEHYNVIVVEDGGKALEILLSESSPSLAIIDWHLPTISGFNICRKIRETKPYGMLYIIMITGMSDARDVVPALEAGADDFLKKPFRREELVARIRSGHRILTLSHEKLEMVTRLQHQQRLESIGQLAAGIAHEINTPMQYIGDNTRFIRDGLEDILNLIHSIEKMRSDMSQNPSCAGTAAELFNAMDEADVPFLSEQIPLAIDQSLEGIKRVTQIVRAMKEFAHPGSGERADTDLNHLIETTTTVTRNEWKYVSTLDLNLEPNLPSVFCFAGDLQQALINLIVNAAHAIADKQKENTAGKIIVSTKQKENMVVIEISDNGCGIPLGLRDRIMEPFFTTKEVGRGTGQGLAVVRSVIVDKHQGTLEFQTEEGKGTTFIISLPVASPVPTS